MSPRTVELAFSSSVAATSFVPDSTSTSPGLQVEPPGVPRTARPWPAAVRGGILRPAGGSGMPSAARLGDKAQVDADAHGCPACPHPGIGPIVTASTDVFVNKKGAARQDDLG